MFILYLRRRGTNHTMRPHGLMPGAEPSADRRARVTSYKQPGGRAHARNALVVVFDENFALSPEFTRDFRKESDNAVICILRSRVLFSIYPSLRHADRENV